MNFRVNAIPKVLLFFSALIPITLGIDAFRKMILPEASVNMVWYDILGLALQIIIFTALDIWGLKLAERQALKKRGRGLLLDAHRLSWREA